jgi:hypothetical protein
MFVSGRASDISKCFVSRQLPAALDRYLTALPAMSLAPVAPLYLARSRSARPLPHGFAGRVARPSRSILVGPALLVRFA